MRDITRINENCKLDEYMVELSGNHLNPKIYNSSELIDFLIKTITPCRIYQKADIPGDRGHWYEI
jgi:hypothetical protein